MREPSRDLPALQVGGPALDRDDAQWSAWALYGDEGVNRLFDYRVVLCRDARGAAPACGQLLGRALWLRIELGRPGAPAVAPRWIHGVVSQAQQLRDSEAGSVYALRLRPWLWRAVLGGRCRIWRQRTVVEVLHELLPAGGAVLQRLRASYPRRDCLVQFNQTDWDCFAALAQQWAINFWFEHRQAAHDLILADHNEALREQPAAAWRNVAIGAAGEQAEHEGLRGLRLGDALGSVAWCGDDIDYTRPARKLAESVGAAAQRWPRREQYHWRGRAGLPPAQPSQREGGDAAEDLAELRARHALALARQQALQQLGQRALAWGPLRGVASGCRLRVHGHRLARANGDWLVLAARLDLRRNGPGPGDWLAQRADAADEDTAWPAWDGDLQPAQAWGGESAAAPDAGGCGDAGRDWQAPQAWARPVLPGNGLPQAWHLHTELVLQRAERALRPELTQAPACAPGVQTALVAAAAGTRPDEGAVHTDSLGRIHVRFAWDRSPQARPGAARLPLQPASTAAVRIAMPWAGREMGQMFLPRVGQQLLVGWVDGDVGQPVALGALYGPLHAPPWQLPGNRWLGGMRSRELAGAPQLPPRGNQLVLDDTPGRAQAQLASDHLYSSLALGWISGLIPAQGLQQPRGEGFELRSDGCGLVHGARGVLLSTHSIRAQDAAADAGPTLRLVRQAMRWHAALAQPRRAPPPTAAAAGEPGPDLVLGGARGMSLVAQGSVQLGALAHLGLASAAEFALRCGSDLLAGAGRGLRLLAHRLGLRLLALAGPLRLEASRAALQASTGRRLRLRAAAELRIEGRRGVLLQGGRSFLRLGPQGIEYGTEGDWVARSAGLRLGGAVDDSSKH